jgi:hypothetical protein
LPLAEAVADRRPEQRRLEHDPPALAREPVELLESFKNARAPL